MALLGEAQKHIISIKDFKIYQKRKYFKHQKIRKNTGFPRDPLWSPLWITEMAENLPLDKSRRDLHMGNDILSYAGPPGPGMLEPEQLA